MARTILKTQFHMPQFYPVCKRDEIQITETPFKNMYEAVKEFDRIVNISNKLIKVKGRFEYQPYDYIQLIKDDIVRCEWRREDHE